jgi:hypothetical protein
MVLYIINMWIKKINEFYENMSEYDNTNLVLHNAVDFIDMLKERVSFELDGECNMTITILKYGDTVKEDTEVDEEGFMFWIQMTFHKELIDIILSLKQKFTTIENTNKKIVNDSKQTKNETKLNDYNELLENNNKELETLSMIMNKVNTYRNNTFSYLHDKEDIDKMISFIRIYKEQSD